MTSKAIAIAVAVLGCAGGGFAAGRVTAVAVATCSAPAAAGGYVPTFQPLPMTTSKNF
jgi:hypothetical protein